MKRQGIKRVRGVVGTSGIRAGLIYKTPDLTKDVMALGYKTPDLTKD